jgi:uncharacterized protein YijF (DUF1287 family)
MRLTILLILIGIATPCFGFREGEPADFSKNLSAAAIERTNHDVRYDGSYRLIPYPNGDVPDDVGVCTDVVIRSYRKLGIDLQKDIHEDMSAAFEKYPEKWGLKKPDPNIDHRRVLNFMTLFQRKGIILPVSDDADDYLPGDLVTWLIPGNLPHIGIVVNKRSPRGNRYMVVHNIGRGPKLEDILFSYKITGHYRYYGE